MHIIEATPTNTDLLLQYATVPIVFSVTTRLAVQPVENGLGGLHLVEEAVTPPYLKDYDALDDEGPTCWQNDFDVSHWGLLCAFDGDTPCGGATIVWNTPNVDMLEGRTDLAVLWDLRVSPAYRGRGIGRLLFAAVVDWAKARGCSELKVETQNINVPACRFYARQGCILRTIHQNAYPDLPDEAQLLWYKPL
jgi:GNAT superfamily N-acetyltransferase